MTSADRQPRVVHVVGGLGLGGGQKLTALVAVGLRRLGYDVSVVNLSTRGHYEAYLRRNGVPVVSLGMTSVGSLRDVLRNVWGLVKLWSLLVRGRWEIVHTHMFRTALVVAPLARLTGSRVFGTSHRIYYPRFQPTAERWLSSLQEAVVVDSAAVREILRAETRIPLEKYVVIHNGIDEEEFDAAPDKQDARSDLGLPEDAVVITCIAHIAEYKGQQYLLEAFDKLARRHRQAYLLLVGDGPMRQPLVSSVGERGLSGRVMLPGARSDLSTVLASSDILALPSVFEGFGIVQAEAMHLGLPVVATDRGGSTEVVDHEVTGFLVPFGDVPELQRRLEQLVSDPTARSAMGHAARDRVSRMFTQRVMAANYDLLYRGG